MKKVVVLIHRQTRNEPSEGTLRAYVITDPSSRSKDKTLSAAARGPNMLIGKKWTSVDSAVQECDRQILALFKLIDPPQIEYVIEDEKATAV